MPNCRIWQEIDRFRLVVLKRFTQKGANYGRFSVWFFPAYGRLDGTCIAIIPTMVPAEKLTNLTSERKNCVSLSSSVKCTDNVSLPYNFFDD